MATATIADHACIEARLSLPRTGVWVLDAIVDVGAAESGAVSARVGDIDLSGYVLRSAVFLGSWHVRVIGGAGQILDAASPKFWQQAALSSVASSLLSSAGESLDASSSLTTTPQWYAVGSCSVGAELSKIATANSTDTVWRVLPGGAVFVGVDSWAESDAVVVELDREPIERLLTLGTASPSMLPGTTYDGLRVDLVEHHVTADSIRTLAWWTE